MGESRAERIRVEVVYALADVQTVIEVDLPCSATVGQAIAASRIADRHPKIDAAAAAVGIFGRQTSLDAAVGDGDRVEIYRPLTVDAKTARRLRARRRS
jgi:putative ubiquitin-RnfH superfamily antitoxin RatB of RatAB toxin-antitoxin module